MCFLKTTPGYTLQYMQIGQNIHQTFERRVPLFIPTYKKVCVQSFLKESADIF